ncbi:hypothetical protein EJV47_10395 [Hymenobacter gummosus]|uniref:Uncharacterized protein n=1 Tax=Hymenobacter gummosus TaxID=1776032 RepID=A0A3S0JHD9_9BACT|nr:hypothetical protein [Hymenobacter gummosus]RTQ50043.1 hypothetical protein EJV47_10395 [Hymenobacter gummosus]
MNNESSFRQNPDEFHGLHADNPENQQRGKDALKKHPEEGQTGPATIGHGPKSPNYGEFGKPEGAAASTAPEGFEPRYGQEDQPAPDQTHHGDDRFRQSGTRNWDTNEPANPHHGQES